MKQLARELAMVHWFRRIWEGLVEPAWIGDVRERHLSRLLNMILLGLLTWGIIFETQSLWNNRFSGAADTIRLLVLAALTIAYYLNRQGQFSAAILLTLAVFITAVFAFVLVQDVQNGSDLSLLYYLIIAILLSDLFFSLRGYLIATALILGGVFAISLLNPAGDVRLRELADLLRLNVREPDLAARYGGEEFAVILPNTSKSGALRLAERLRRAAEASTSDRNHERSFVSGYTISLGVATYPDDAASIEELLLAADNAELTAKRLGKNRVYAANVSYRVESP